MKLITVFEKAGYMDYADLVKSILGKFSLMCACKSVGVYRLG